MKQDWQVTNNYYSWQELIMRAHESVFTILNLVINTCGFIIPVSLLLGILEFYHSKIQKKTCIIFWIQF